jgi:GGDEF domain-containing protein
MQVAATLSKMMRGGDVLARVGGDECAVPALAADHHAGLEIAERMLNGIEERRGRGLGSTGEPRRRSR